MSRYDIKERPRSVHRLDRDSSGILVMGRTETSTAILHSIFREKTVGISEDKETDLRKRNLQKRFLALVFGVPNQLKGMISVPLTKVRRDNVDGNADASDCPLKRFWKVGAKDVMREGERIFLPIGVMEPPIKKQEYECSEEEMNFIRCLEIYKSGFCHNCYQQTPKTASTGK
ncbi:RNA pseudouridine synthase 4, mitochondrial-like isoform X3 [Amaranthus tricolor]|uniref:RNA pseudouridine synthase 4, mitochondrial-like isoform X3 n=1 Tax=Amaranthus tricolor TaxID=29722 RepID=UPI00258B4FA5|nr:RNA pseudouridine synthase 4, mitochondrial-like isoform X3 [Amaranthus tricolor]